MLLTQVEGAGTLYLAYFNSQAEAAATSGKKVRRNQENSGKQVRKGEMDAVYGDNCRLVIAVDFNLPAARVVRELD
jgi:hypothetical protein